MKDKQKTSYKFHSQNSYNIYMDHTYNNLKPLHSFGFANVLM